MGDKYTSTLEASSLQLEAPAAPGVGLLSLRIFSIVRTIRWSTAIKRRWEFVCSTYIHSRYRNEVHREGESRILCNNTLEFGECYYGESEGGVSFSSCPPWWEKLITLEKEASAWTRYLITDAVSLLLGHLISFCWYCTIQMGGFYSGKMNLKYSLHFPELSHSSLIKKWLHGPNLFPSHILHRFSTNM